MTASILATLISPSLASLSSFLDLAWSNAPRIAIIIMVTAVLTVSLFPLVRIGWFRWSHILPINLRPLRHLHSVLAIPLSLSLIHITTSNHWLSELIPWPVGLNSDETLICMGVFAAALVLAASYYAWQTKHDNSDTPSPSNSPDTSESPPSPDELRQRLTTSFDELLKWIQEEQPIEDPSNDLFDMLPLAESLADLIIKDPTNAIGITGEFGSGKTSLIRLIQSHIKKTQPTHKKHFIHVTVDEWGLTDASATTQILESGVNELSKRTDTLSIAGLPKAYLASIQKTSPPWWLAWLAWLCRQNNALEELKRLNHLAHTLNLHLIFYVEDVDRNESDHGELQSLLDKLKKRNNMTFVLSATKSRFDFSRLCEHHEPIPNLPNDFLNAVIQSFRYNALIWAADKHGDIDPHRSRDDLNNLKGLPPQTPPTSTSGLLNILLQGLTSIPSPALEELLCRPRILKLTLRNTWKAWNKLHGEIDFEQLLVAQTIKTINSNALDFLHDLLSDRNPNPSSNSNKDIARRKSIHQDWNNRLSATSEHDRKCLSELAYWLVGLSPHNQENWKPRTNPNQASIRYAGKYADYWIRIYRGIHSNQYILADQAVLKQCMAWKQNKPNTLVQDLLTKEYFSNTFERFQSAQDRLQESLFFSINDIYQLSDEEHKQFTEILESKASLRLQHGYPTPWRIARNTHTEEISRFRHIRWACRQIDQSLEHSLALALDINTVWMSKELHPIKKKDRAFTRLHLFKSVKDKWSRSEETIDAILSADTTELMASTWRLTLIGRESESLPYKLEDCRWLIPLLRSRLSKNPKLMIPIIMKMIQRSPTTAANIDQMQTTFLNKSVTCELIPDQPARLDFIKALLTEIKSKFFNQWNPDVAAVVSKMQLLLVQWVNEGVPEPLTNDENEDKPNDTPQDQDKPA